MVRTPIFPILSALIPKSTEQPIPSLYTSTQINIHLQRTSPKFLRDACLHFGRLPLPLFLLATFFFCRRTTPSTPPSTSSSPVHHKSRLSIQLNSALTLSCFSRQTRSYTLVAYALLTTRRVMVCALFSARFISTNPLRSNRPIKSIMTGVFIVETA